MTRRLSLAFSLGFTLMGAFIFSFSRFEETVVPQEAVIGITFVVASAAVILIAGFTAEGAEHIAETLTGTLIWVGWPEIIRMAIVYTILGVIYFIFRKPFLSISLGEADRPRARAWDFLFYVLFGIVISFSVPVAGVLMVFSSLVIPAVVAFPLHEPVQCGPLDRVGRWCGRARDWCRGVLQFGHPDRSATGMYVRVGCGDRPTASVRFRACARVRSCGHRASLGGSGLAGGRTETRCTP